MALSNKYKGNGNVSLAFFGDGASNQGQVYEAFNMAKLWSLPVVFVIEIVCVWRKYPPTPLPTPRVISGAVIVVIITSQITGFGKNPCLTLPLPSSKQCAHIMATITSPNTTVQPSSGRCHQAAAIRPLPSGRGHRAAAPQVREGDF